MAGLAVQPGQPVTPQDAVEERLHDRYGVKAAAVEQLRCQRVVTVRCCLAAAVGFSPCLASGQLLLWHRPVRRAVGDDETIRRRGSRYSRHPLRVGVRVRPRVATHATRSGHRRAHVPNSAATALRRATPQLEHVQQTTS